MTVTGTEQRVYGTLVGNCIIDLHRFALVSGSTTQSPIEATTVTYADTTPYRQCGYKHSGFLTLFLLTSTTILSETSVYAAVEVRICKNDPKILVLETYGEVANTVTGGISVWFNKGSDTAPDWRLLNSTTENTTMTGTVRSYKFTESKRNGSVTIDCCKTCPGCGCVSRCQLTGLIFVEYWEWNGHEIRYDSKLWGMLYFPWIITVPMGLSIGGDYTHGCLLFGGGGYLSLGPYNTFECLIEYKMTCDDITIKIDCDLNGGNYYDWALHKLRISWVPGDLHTSPRYLLYEETSPLWPPSIFEIPRFSGSNTVTLPYGILHHCVTLVCSSNCGDYITVTNKNVKDLNETCPIVGKQLNFNGWLTGTIEEIVDDYILKLNRNSLTCNLQILQSTFIYDKNNEFSVELDIEYINTENYAYQTLTYFYDFAHPLHPEIVHMSFDYEWDIDVTHTPTGHTFKQHVYTESPYSGWAWFGFFYDHDGIRDTTSPIRFDAPQAEFPFSGSKSGITTLESRKYYSDYQGTTILTIQCKLFAIYQPPHDYTGVLKLRIFNIKYFNCRGDEIHNGDKCLPIFEGYHAKINPI